MCSNAIYTLEHNYGEFINGYIKNIKFIADFVEKSENKELYIKFVISQLSKYELVTLFYYCCSNREQNITEIISNLGLLHSINNQECRTLMIDMPSEQDINKDLINIF